MSRDRGPGKRLEGDLFLPIALQNYMAVDVGDYTIDDFTGFRGETETQDQQHGQGAISFGFHAGRAGSPVATPDSLFYLPWFHQKDCPTLNEKLKCPARWYPNCPTSCPVTVLVVMFV